MHTGTTFPCFCLNSTMVSLIHGTTLLWVAAFLVLKSLYYWWLCLFTLYWNLANLSFVTSNGQNQEYVLKSKKKKKKTSEKKKEKSSGSLKVCFENLVICDIWLFPPWLVPIPRISIHMRSTTHSQILWLLIFKLWVAVFFLL